MSDISNIPPEDKGTNSKIVKSERISVEQYVSQDMNSASGQLIPTSAMKGTRLSILSTSNNNVHSSNNGIADENQLEEKHAPTPLSKHNAEKVALQAVDYAKPKLNYKCAKGSINSVAFSIKTDGSSVDLVHSKLKSGDQKSIASSMNSNEGRGKAKDINETTVLKIRAMKWVIISIGLNVLFIILMSSMSQESGLEISLGPINAATSLLLQMWMVRHLIKTSYFLIKALSMGWIPHSEYLWGF
jgi:hypothetical protein